MIVSTLRFLIPLPIPNDKKEQEHLAVNEEYSNNCLALTSSHHVLSCLTVSQSGGVPR